MQQKMDFIWQSTMISSLVWPRRCPKALHKAKLGQKRSGSLFGGLLSIWSTKTFWTLAKPLHLRSVLSRSEIHQKLQCLPLAVVNRKGPALLHDNTWLHIEQPVLQKLNELGYKVLPHPWYSPDLLPTNYHLFKHLDNISRGKCFPNQQDAENALQEFAESQNTDFYVQE